MDTQLTDGIEQSKFDMESGQSSTENLRLFFTKLQKTNTISSLDPMTLEEIRHFFSKIQERSD